MKFPSLDAWLAWQETLNPAEIDLGLERVSEVLARMGHADHFECPLVMVAGTNGKGSVVAITEAMARAAGYRVCTYTSPHFIAYNERIRIDGEAVDDASLCAAFERVDRARGEVPLTYFEFGTLAAIGLFMRAAPDLVIMEIGLGGRLDAVNVMQPDVSVITSIAIDHTDWLGDDRDTIGREKAGIARAGRPLICGDPEPPVSVLDTASAMAARLYVCGLDYHALPGDDHWDLQSSFGDLEALPLPALAGKFQTGNAATAIIALQALASRLPLSREHIDKGLSEVRLPGRFDELAREPQVIADVAHNPQAVAALVAHLQQYPATGRTRVVIAMLADKPVDEVIALLAPVVDDWYPAGLAEQRRGLGANGMLAAVKRGLQAQGRLAEAGMDVKLSAESTVEAAVERALDDAGSRDRIVIMGSFYTAAAAMRYFS